MKTTVRIFLYPRIISAKDSRLQKIIKDNPSKNPLTRKGNGVK